MLAMINRRPNTVHLSLLLKPPACFNVVADLCISLLYVKMVEAVLRLYLTQNNIIINIFVIYRQHLLEKQYFDFCFYMHLFTSLHFQAFCFKMRIS